MLLSNSPRQKPDEGNTEKSGREHEQPAEQCNAQKNDYSDLSNHMLIIFLIRRCPQTAWHDIGLIFILASAVSAETGLDDLTLKGLIPVNRRSHPPGARITLVARKQQTVDLLNGL
jgi:hypothetical protein